MEATKSAKNIIKNIKKAKKLKKELKELQEKKDKLVNMNEKDNLGVDRPEDIDGIGQIL